MMCNVSYKPYTCIMPVRRPPVQTNKRKMMAAKKASAANTKTVPARVHAGMTVSEIISLYPQVKDILAEYGLHCFGCAFNALETLEEGCKGHGFDDSDIENLVTDVNDAIAALPPREQILTLTEAAAKAIGDIAKTENRLGQGLAVISEGNGGFCMEFRETKLADERTFSNAAVPEVCIYASEMTLSHIGGSTIDFRDGRFKLDLEAAATSGCACGGSCSCT